MLPQNFVNCIVEQLKEKGFGKKRTDALLQRADGLHEGYKAEGMSEGDAFAKAQTRLFDELRREKIEKFRAKEVMVERTVSGFKRLDEAQASGKKATKWAWDGGSTQGAYLARSVISMLTDDPRFKGNSLALAARQTFEDLCSQLGSSLDKYGKGIFGIQKGLADERDFVRAMFGDFRGSPDAIAFGRAFTDVVNGSLASFRRAGGAANALDDFHMPDPMRNKYSMEKAKKDGTLLKIIKENADLANMRRPDGRPLPLGDEKEIDKILLEAAESKIQNGLNKEGGGRSLFANSTTGDMRAKHRFFKWKDGDAWMNVHNALGDGTAYDVMLEFLRERSNDIAAVKILGRNPRATLQNIINEGEKRAAKLGVKDQAEFNDVITNRALPMMDALMGHAIPNAENSIAVNYGIIANLVRSASLQAAPLIAVPSDQVTSVFMRHLNKTGETSGLRDLVRYFAANRGEGQQFLANLGYINDSVVETLHSNDRFSRFAELGPAWSRATSNAVMRANGMSAMTEAARQSFRLGTLVDLAQRLGTEYEKLPAARTLSRYGIEKADWDAFRAAIKPMSPDSHPGARLVNLTHLREQKMFDLYDKFQSFVIQESYNAVPDSNIEAHIILTGGHRPDTLVGALTNSFSMFKNMSVYVPMLIARQLMASDAKPLTKAAYAASIMGALSLVGAAKMQVQEVVMNGRTPRQMDAAYWTRALAVGGGLGWAADMVYGTVDSVKGRGMNDILAGAAATPVGALGNLLGNMAIDSYKFATGDLSGEKMSADLGHQALVFMNSITPGTFYTHMAVQRLMFEKLDQMVDPAGFRKRQRQKENMARNKKGNEPLQFR